MLYFNADKYEFWNIYDCIKKYYPIGIRRDEGSMYRSYPGQNELASIIVDKIHDDDHFKCWRDFDALVEQRLQKEVIGTTYGQIPAFSSYVQWEKQPVGELTRLKELHYFVSLIGSFYTIIGQDRNQLTTGHGVYFTTNYQVISPVFEFTEGFHTIIELMNDRFKGYRLVPNGIYTQCIEGLYLGHEETRRSATVFEALFGNDTFLSARVEGNQYYGADAWIKKGYVDDGEKWTAVPPGSPIGYSEQ